jgi:sugar O-acyltransferase (sialic acid O-acetyltransferase NeuD family)
VCDAIISQNGSIAGYMTEEKTARNPYDLHYLGFEDDASAVEAILDKPYFVAIGENRVRARITEYLNPFLGKPINVAHKTATISPLSAMGYGVFVGPKAIINPSAYVSDGCIINSGAIVEHECDIGSFSHIAPGAILAGNVIVGTNTFVGAGAVVREGITIGDNVTIGAGTVVIKDVPPNVTLVGNPGRMIRK